MIQSETSWGAPLKEVYLNSDAAPESEHPGKFPFTRGIHAEMYRRRIWTMRQYAGFGSAKETNARYRYLLANGVTGLSVAFDLPTQMGRDSDHQLAHGEVGRVGVAISSIEDMELLCDGIPLDQVSVSMTINATASILLALYLVCAERRGIPWNKLRGTIQNDVLKEYLARGTYIYPPRPALRIVTDIFAFCSKNVPEWNTISISGYHIREAGSTAVDEVAFTLANGMAYVKSAIDAGLDVDEFAPRLAFFFNCHNNLFEEVAKFRAARRIWAGLMRDVFGAKQGRSLMLRFHTQTAGSSLTAQQPLNNVVRTTVQAMAAVMGGTQSLHTNSFDEALGLPTEESAKLALRTQQIIAAESGIASVVDPLAGSYFVESLTDEIEKGVRKRIEQIDGLGGMVPAIEAGVPQQHIDDAAFRYQQRVESGEQSVVGVNIFIDQEMKEMPIQHIDPALEKEQVERLKRFKAKRDQNKLKSAISGLEQAAKATTPLMPYIVDAVRAGATVGEISDVMRSVFGEHRPNG